MTSGGDQDVIQSFSSSPYVAHRDRMISSNIFLKAVSNCIMAIVNYPSLTSTCRSASGHCRRGCVHLVSHCPEVIEGGPTTLGSCVSHATARLSQIPKLSLHTVHASSSARLDFVQKNKHLNSIGKVLQCALQERYIACDSALAPIF